MKRRGNDTERALARLIIGERNICIPARMTAEFFGYHLKYEDWSYNRLGSPEITLMSGDDLREVSGVVGNSYFKWSISLPDGFFAYSDSIFL